MGNVILKMYRTIFGGEGELVFRTTTSNESIILPTSGVNNYNVNWGDASSLEHVSTTNPTHTYVTAGDYTVSIDGYVGKWDFKQISNSVTKLIEINKFDATEMGLTSLENSFYGCINLDTIVGDEFKTEYVTSFNGLFEDCSSLTSLDASTWNTSKVSNMGNTFKNSSITGLTLTNWDTSKVSSTSGMFSDMSSLTSINIFNWDMGANTDMSSMFYNCSGVTSINLSGITTSNQLTDLSYTFNNCESITNIDVSNLNTTNVTTIESIFGECDDLTTITGLSNWDTNNITSMKQSFYRCYDLTELTGITNWNTSKVTNMYSMFNDMSVITSLDLSNWDTSRVTNMYSMLYGCDELITTGNLSNWDVSNVTNMESMFSGSTKITDDSIDAWWDGSNSQITAHTDTFTDNTLRPDYNCIPTSWGGGETEICDASAELLYNTQTNSYYITLPIYNSDVRVDWGDGSVLEHIVNTTTPPTHTYSTAGDHIVKLKGQITTWSYQDLADDLHGSFRLKEITSFNAEKLGITDMHGAFSNCKNVTLDSSNIYLGSQVDGDLSYFFYNGFEITELDITTWGLYRPTSLKHFCSDCDKLTDFEPLGELTRYVTTMASMFWSCDSLVTIDTLSWWKNSLIDVNHMFGDCDNLETVNSFGSTSNNIDVSYMFYHTPKITDYAMRWWEGVNYSPHNECFTSNTKRPNYSDIPWDWK